MEGKVKKITDLVREKSVELLGCTPEERSDENIEWMSEHGYLPKKRRRRRIGKLETTEARSYFYSSR